MAIAHFQQNPTYRITAAELPGQVVAHSEDNCHLFHCCNINGSACIIYPRHLARTDPKMFFDLEAFASRNGLQLIQERRSIQTPIGKNKRRPWLPVLLLTFTTATVFAEPQPSTYWQQSLAMATEINGEFLQETDVERTPKASQEDNSPPVRESEDIFNILRNHYQTQVDDPFTLEEELRRLASYYARFPPVVQLFNQLADAPWTLKYERRSFRTEVTGNSLKVEQATVFFDPKFGARLKFQSSCREKIPYCVASPADALLHEMLHLKTILLNTTEYIASGALGGLIYPFEHERETIAMENTLYRAMTAVDGLPRPIRSGHTGRYVMVACATCIE